MVHLDLILSIVAITLSGISIAATTTLAVIQYRHQSAAKLKLRHSWSYPARLGVGLGSAHLAISATNKRQIPTTITGWGITWPTGKGQQLAFIDTRDDFGQLTGPIEVAHGQTIERYFEKSRITEQATTAGLAFPIRVRAWVNTAAGTKFKSREFEIDDPQDA